MTAICGLSELHAPHAHFCGWPRETVVCDGIPTRTADALARDLIERARADLVDDLLNYLNGAARGMSERATGDDGRWAIGYLAALGDVVGRINKLRWQGR